MSYKNSRLISLAGTHSKLIAASDLVRWSMTAETEDIIGRAEAESMIARLRELAGKAFDAMKNHPK